MCLGPYDTLFSLSLSLFVTCFIEASMPRACRFSGSTHLSISSLVWMFLFLFLLFPVGVGAFCLLAFFAAIWFHLSMTFSLLIRILVHSGAMGAEPIVDAQMEANMSVTELTGVLWQRASTNQEQGKSLSQLYARSVFPQA